MKLFALLAIRFYQRMISPYKGFCCAYAAYTGHASCSALGYRAIRRYGVVDGIAVLDARLAKCGVAYRRYRPQALRALASQAGFLDCDCGPGCDVDGCDSGSGSKNLNCLSSACDCSSCDWDSKKKKRKPEDERTVVLPPNARAR